MSVKVDRYIRVTFWLLLVVSRAETQVTPNGTKKTRWECLCDCGNVVVATYQNLKVGYTKSCGCFRTKCSIERFTTHNMTKTKTYNSYHSMLKRCYDPSYKNFKYWGGRGVSVCDRWLESFENFLEDMGERPEGTTLNRIGSSKIYSKETCNWADKKEQSFDQRVRKDNSTGVTGVSHTKSGKYYVRITVDGKTLSLGTFKNFDEAVRVRVEAEILYYGRSKGGSHL
jgi:hypothetical protein